MNDNNNITLETMTLSKKEQIEINNIKKESGKLVIYQFPNGQPYIQKVNGGLIDTDALDKVMKRAKVSRKLRMAEEMAANEIATHLIELTKEYGKKAHESARKEAEKRDAKEREIYKRSQMYNY